MKALFFGLGGIGQRHLRNLRKLDPAIQIGAVRARGRKFEIGDDLQPDYDTDIMSKYDISSFSSLKDAMESQPDFGIVSNPTSCHVSIANELVLNGVPVFLEKPVSDSTEGLSQLIKDSREEGVPIMVGYMMRFHPSAIKLKELVEGRRIGKIYSIVLTINSYLPAWHKYEKCNEFYAGMKSLGGGVVLTEIHELDLLYWYFGLPEKLWAVGGKLSDLELDVEDTVSILLAQNFNDERFPVNINMSFVQRTFDRNMLIQGEYGKIEWDISHSKIILEDKVTSEVETYDYPDFRRNDMFINELEHFIECVRSNKVPITSLENVIGGHLTALTVKKSLEEDTVTVPVQLS